jgi:haloalkane dehalogenase
LLDLRDVTRVMHDWGGPIGMSYALAHPNTVKALVVKGMKWVERVAFVMGSSLGKFMCRDLNILPRFAIAPALVDKTRFPH